MDVFDKAHEVVKELSHAVNVFNAQIDDYKEYGDYVDFQAVVFLNVHRSGGGPRQAYRPDTDPEKFTLRKTSNQIRKILTENSSVMAFGKAIDCPQRVYDWDGYNSIFVGYEKDYIMVDFKMAI